jgi:hypothetical protein
MAIPAAVEKTNSRLFTSLKQLFCSFFSRKEITVVCFILAILFKTALTFYYQQIDNDKLFQAMAAKNVAEGHGLTIKQVHAHNLSKEVYEPLAIFPPAYSLVIAIFYSITNNLKTSCFITDILSIIFYFIILIKLFRLLQIPPYVTNLLLLFNGLAIKSYTALSTPTDLITLDFSLAAVYFVLKLYTNKEAIGAGIWLGIINILPAWFRFMYIPITFVIPSFLLWNGWMKKDKRLIRYGLQTMVLAIAGITLLLIFQKLNAGNAIFLAETERGIFWLNLLLLHPILFSALFNLEFFYTQLSLRTGFTFSQWNKLIQSVHYVLFIVLLVRFLYFSFKKKWVAANMVDSFLLLGFLISLSILLLLGFLSLTHSLNFPPPSHFKWTFLSAARYFIFIEVFFTLIITRWLFVNRNFRGKRLLQCLFICVISIEIVHSLYFLGKHFSFERKGLNYAVTQNEMDDYIKNTIKRYKAKNIEVVVAGHVNLANRSVLWGGNGMLNQAELNFEKIQATKPTVLIAVIQSDQLSFYSPFLSKKDVKQESKIGDFYFYSRYIEPNRRIPD